MPQSGPHLPYKHIVTCQQASHDNRAFGEQLRASALAWLWSPEDDVTFRAHLAHIRLSTYQSLETDNWKLKETNICFPAFSLPGFPNTLLTASKGKQASQGHQPVMFNAFRDTFAYLIGALSCLRFRQFRKHPWGLQLLLNPQIRRMLYYTGE